MLPYYYVFKNFRSKKDGYVRTLALVQGVYFFVTGFWPIIDINSFMAVTGPKTDIWLVKMVGLLTISISLLLLMIAQKGRLTSESIVLIISSCLGYFAIDVYYSFTRVISYIYLGDAVLQLLFMALWFGWLIKIRFRLRNVNNE